MHFGLEIFENVSGMLKRVPDLMTLYTKQEMVRFGVRFRRTMKKEHMTGRPGIDAPKLSRLSDKNLTAWAKGNSLSNIATTGRITRILKVHEEGALIAPNTMMFLTSRSKAKWTATMKSDRIVIGKAMSVRIPPRLGFLRTWREMIPDELGRIQAAQARALKAAGEQAVKQVIRP